MVGGYLFSSTSGEAGGESCFEGTLDPGSSRTLSKAGEKSVRTVCSDQVFKRG